MKGFLSPPGNCAFGLRPLISQPEPILAPGAYDALTARLVDQVGFPAFFGPQTWRLMFVVGAIPALFTLYIRRAIDESERWQKAVREQRWAATEHASDMVTKMSRRPFSLAEIFRERESRMRVVLAFPMSLATMVGWWAISSWLPVFTQGLARAQGYANPVVWGARAALFYTSGAVVAYLLSGFVADGIGRRMFLFLTYAGALVMTPVTYLWTHSVERMMFVACINGFFSLGCAYSHLRWCTSRLQLIGKAMGKRCDHCWQDGATC